MPRRALGASRRRTAEGSLDALGPGLGVPPDGEAGNVREGTGRPLEIGRVPAGEAAVEFDEQPARRTGPVGQAPQQRRLPHAARPVHVEREGRLGFSGQRLPEPAEFRLPADERPGAGSARSLPHGHHRGSPLLMPRHRTALRVDRGMSESEGSHGPHDSCSATVLTAFFPRRRRTAGEETAGAAASRGGNGAGPGAAEAAAGGGPGGDARWISRRRRWPRRGRPRRWRRPRRRPGRRPWSRPRAGARSASAPPSRRGRRRPATASRHRPARAPRR
ncbi:hypothetical protein SAMN05428944_0966 [Streptomyces sp. 1222.5]|nr:hypothetical protein SAMN05428944_0966 [Streptomyces sp. 1222.5]